MVDAFRPWSLENVHEHSEIEVEVIATNRGYKPSVIAAMTSFSPVDLCIPADELRHGGRENLWVAVVGCCDSLNLRWCQWLLLVGHACRDGDCWQVLCPPVVLLVVVFVVVGDDSGRANEQ